MICYKVLRVNPPLPIFLLNNLIPITMFDNSTNWVTFSEGFKDKNGPNDAFGITLSKANAISFSTLNMDYVSYN